MRISNHNIVGEWPKLPVDSTTTTTTRSLTCMSATSDESEAQIRVCTIVVNTFKPSDAKWLDIRAFRAILV